MQVARLWNFGHRPLFPSDWRTPDDINVKRRAIQALEEAGFLHVFDARSLETDEHSPDEQQWRRRI
jgi:hypothetical protein